MLLMQALPQGEPQILLNIEDHLSGTTHVDNAPFQVCCTASAAQKSAGVVVGNAVEVPFM